MKRFIPYLAGAMLCLAAAFPMQAFADDGQMVRAATAIREGGVTAPEAGGFNTAMEAGLQTAGSILTAGGIGLTRAVIWLLVGLQTKTAFAII